MFPFSRRGSGASAVPALLLLLASTLSLAGTALAPRDDGLVAAVFPPGLDRNGVLERVAAADAVLVRLGAWDGIAVAASTRPGLAARLRAAGAWLVLDPIAAAGCPLPSSPAGR